LNINGTKKKSISLLLFTKELEKVEVCKSFYLATLGLSSNSIIRSVMSKTTDSTGADLKPNHDNRGKYSRQKN
jgi:hypothetical protein